MKTESNQPTSTDMPDMAHPMIPPKPSYEEEEQMAQLTIEDSIERITDEDQFFHMLATVDKLGKAIAKLQK